MRCGWPLALLLVGCVLTPQPADPSGSTDDTDAATHTDAATPAPDSDPPVQVPWQPTGDTQTSCVPPAVDCGGVCADLDADAAHCGTCGRTCVIPGAVAACELGACTIASCDLGLADCDRDPTTGCEEPVSCVDAAPCDATCGSVGAIDCTDPCTPTCLPPAESCDATDDDCDGQCDEGALPGCRVPIHRAYGGNGHLFTTDLLEAQRYGLEAAAFFHLYASAAADLRPFFRCQLGSAHFYTTSNDCELTGAPRSTLGFIAPHPPGPGGPTCGSVPLYRLALPPNGWHFYTVSAPERDSAVASGWVDEGIAGYVWRGP